MKTEIRLTQYAHGAGCGCKISPKVLDDILRSDEVTPGHSRLLVGNHSRDDAAVYDLGNGTALISTTDFFMPIVDDPFTFGRIASVNAISDVYAMGGKPVMAIAILGWPVNKLSAEAANQVMEGGRKACMEAGIPLAGGHSIDSPEPFFGLAVNGLAPVNHIKQNNTAKAGNLLFLTKPLGIGILTTAGKKGMIREDDLQLATRQMVQLNSIGEAAGALTGVTAMTDVTGFGLLGHLTEMAEGSGVSAEIYFDHVPLITSELENYVSQGCAPGGTQRNWDSYGHKIAPLTSLQKTLLADPQTSGGLLIAVEEKEVAALEEIFKRIQPHIPPEPIGRIIPKEDYVIKISQSPS